MKSLPADDTSIECKKKSAHHWRSFLMVKPDESLFQQHHLPSLDVAVAGQAIDVYA
jgi:hypothetical protein